MQQSILALGALLIIMMTAINHQRSTIILQETAYLRELENAAADLAEMRLEMILNLTTFDEDTTPAVNFTTLPADVTGLSSTFGPDESSEIGPVLSENHVGTFDDLDDFHNYQQTFWHTIGADSFLFLIDYQVQYVDPTNGGMSTSRTFAKELITTVTSQDSVGMRVARVSFSKTASIHDFLN